MFSYKLIFFHAIFLFIISSCKESKKSYELDYGYHLKEDGVGFKIYAPSSDSVFVVIFNEFGDSYGTEHSMKKQQSGDWEITIEGLGVGTLYGYRLTGPLNDPDVIVADPYSKSAVTQNNFRHVAKSLIIDESFNWGNDSWSKVKMHDLVIYEAHLRDMTIDETSRAKSKGTYKGFIEPGQKGGIEHLKNLGVNAVQFLPLWDFANFEIPYLVDTVGFFQ